MINLKRIYGENFCQYAKLNQPLNPGLTLLLGMNGSGKSNLVRAIYLCLVGEVYGTKNLVKDGRQNGFVALEADTPKGPLTVSRRLKHNNKTKGTSITHKLDADWLPAPLTKKADIEAFLAPHIGVPLHALEYLSFALQGKFDALMMMEHTPRAKILNMLMGLDRAEKLRVILKDMQDRIADLPDRTEQIKHYQEQLIATAKDLLVAEAALAAAQAQVTDTVKQAHAQAVTINNQASSEGRDNLIVEQQALIDGQTQPLFVLRAEIATLPDTKDLKPPDNDGNFGYTKLVAAKEHVSVEQQALDNLKGPKEPPKDAKDAAGEANAEVLRDIHVELMQLKAKIDGFGTGVCPTCSRAFEVTFDIAELNKEFTKGSAEYEELRKNCEQARTTIRTYDQAKAAFDSTVTRTKEVLATAETLVKSLKEHAGFDVDAYNKAQTEYAAALVKSQKRIEVERKIHEHEQFVSSAKTAIAELKALLVATPEQKLWATSMIAAYTTTEEKISHATVARDALVREAANCKQRIEMFEKDMEKAGANIKARELFRLAREQLHVEKLPRLAAQGSIAAINKKMKKYLDMFAFPFGFRLNEDCDFVVDFDTSKDHAAAILSGGESVRAALAVRFAIIDVFSAGCGILVLDEPTTALDEEALTALVEVLGIAGRYFKKHNIKILCPTHAPQLSSVADTLVTVGE